MRSFSYRSLLGAAVLSMALVACGEGGDAGDDACLTGAFCPCSAAVPCPDPVAETCDLTLGFCIARAADAGGDDVADDASDVAADADELDAGDSGPDNDAALVDAGADVDTEVVPDVVEWPDALDDQLALFLGFCLDLCALQRDCAPEGSDPGPVYDSCAASCQAPVDAAGEGSGEFPEACVFAILDYFSCASRLTCEYAFDPTDPDSGCGEEAAAQVEACPRPPGD
jgi:hypothetical protein